MLLASGADSCAGPERMLVVGHYYTAPTDGDERLYFDDPQVGATELGAPSVVGIAKGYMASFEGGESSCFLFPADAATAEAARNGQIGPMTGAVCEQKVFQLTGDSLRLWSLYENY